MTVFLMRLVLLVLQRMHQVRLLLAQMLVWQIWVLQRML